LKATVVVGFPLAGPTLFAITLTVVQPWVGDPF
jgi:hypothetical protein